MFASSVSQIYSYIREGTELDVLKKASSACVLRCFHH